MKKIQYNFNTMCNNTIFKKVTIFIWCYSGINRRPVDADSIGMEIGLLYIKSYMNYIDAGKFI